MAIKNDMERRVMTRSAVPIRLEASYLRQAHRASPQVTVDVPPLAVRRGGEDIRRWEGYVDALLQELEEGILVSDEAGRIIKINAQAERFLGVSGSHVIGRSLKQVWEDRELPALPFSSYEYRGRRLQGHEVFIGDGYRAGSGHIRVLVDITKLVRMEEQIRTSQRSATMGEMVGRVAHEIRNPLASIELLASLMGATTHSEGERHRLADQISMVVRTLDQLLSNLLVMSGPPKPRMQVISVEKLIQDTILMATPSIRERGIILRNQVGEGARTIEGDELMIRQSLLNLLLNAIQASSDEGTIEVSSECIPAEQQRNASRRTGGGQSTGLLVSLRVRDFGRGIPSEDQSQVFDPFFSRRQGGTGLGLAIVRQVMEVHGGWIRCDSEIGKGTTFQLCFPQGRKSA